MKIRKILENINNIDITHSSDDELLQYINGVPLYSNELYDFISIIPQKRNITDAFAIKLVKHNVGFLINALLDGGYYPPENVMITWVKKDPSIFEYIVLKKIPPHDVQLAAISKNGFAIKSLFLKGYIPHDDVILAAIKNKNTIGAYIKKHIPFPSKAVADALYERTKGKHDLRKLARDSHPIRSNFNDWTEDELKRLVQTIDAVCLELVFKQLKKAPSIEIQKIAAKRNGMIIKYLPKPIDKSLIDIALGEDPNAISAIDNPTLEQQMSAVTRKITSLLYIKHPAPEVINYAITSHSSDFISYMPPEYITDDMQLLALDSDPRHFKIDMLLSIPKPTTEFLNKYAGKYGVRSHVYIKKRNLLTHDVLNNLLTATINFSNEYIFDQYKQILPQIFRDNALLLNKWLRYGEKMRSTHEAH